MKDNTSITRFEKSTSQKKLSKLFKRSLIGIICLITLAFLFSSIESWRGKRTWRNTCEELEAQGFIIDWKEAIPKPIPDDQNLALARVMTGCITGHEGQKLGDWHDEPIFDETAIAASEQVQEIFDPYWFSGVGDPFSFQLPDTDTLDIFGSKNKDRFKKLTQIIEPYHPILAELRAECIKRPESYLPGDYSVAYGSPFLDFKILISATALLTTEAVLALHNGNSALALENCLAMHRINNLNRQVPFLINVIIETLMIRSFMTKVLWYGISHDAFNEDQLKTIAALCTDIDLIKKTRQSFEYELLINTNSTRQFIAKPVETINVFYETDGIPLFIASDKIIVTELTAKTLWHFIPATGWNLQILSRHAKITGEYCSMFDLENDRVNLDKLRDNTAQLKRLNEKDALFDSMLISSASAYQNLTESAVDTQRRIDLLYIAASLCLAAKQDQILPDTISSFKETLPADPTNGLHYSYEKHQDAFTISSVSQEVDLSVTWKPQPIN